MNKRQRAKVNKLIQYYMERDSVVKHSTFNKLLGDKRVISVQVNPLNDFRNGENIVIPDNTIMYQSIIDGSNIYADELHIDGCYVTVVNNNVFPNKINKKGGSNEEFTNQK